MAKRAFTTAGRTFTASAAGAVASAGNAYMAIKGGSATQTIDVLEVLFSGKVGTSTVIGLMLKRASTLETTPTALSAANFESDGPMHPATAALAAVPVSFTVAGTNPTPSSAVTDASLNLGLNGFGGIVRWNAAPTQQWTIVTATAPGGESVLFNCSSAGGVSCAGDAHILYEPY